MARAMKDSGIAWIGEIPEEWTIERGKNILKLLERPVQENDGVITCFRDGEVTLRSKRREESFTISLQEAGYQGIEPGDLVVHGMDGFAGAIGISDSRGKGTPVLNVMDSSQSKRYLMYYLRCAAYCGLFLSLATGIRVRSCDTNWNKLKNILYILPPLEEQRKIIRFLDSECARIDALIEQTRASIEEYKKLKQVVITQAVTKGIRPNRPMKDSGIDWIGQIPEEWEIVPFRHVLQERNEKNNPVKTKERLSLSIDLGVTLYAEKTTNLDRFKEDFEQYKIAHVGDLVMNSMNMIVGATGVSSYHGCVSPAYYTFYDTLDDHVTAKYCEYIFRSKTMLRVLYSLGKGIYAIVRGDDRVNTCRLKVSREDLRNIALPMPSVCEQREIVRFLQDKLSEIDMVIAKKEQFLSEMESYKKSLIFEYVTGKKEVAQ